MHYDGYSSIPQPFDVFWMEPANNGLALYYPSFIKHLNIRRFYRDVTYTDFLKMKDPYVPAFFEPSYSIAKSPTAMNIARELRLVTLQLNNMFIPEDFVLNLPTLRRLILRECNGVRPVFLASIAKKHASITALDLSCCHFCRSDDRERNPFMALQRAIVEFARRESVLLEELHLRECISDRTKAPEPEREELTISVWTVVSIMKHSPKLKMLDISTAESEEDSYWMLRSTRNCRLTPIYEQLLITKVEVLRMAGRAVDQIYLRRIIEQPQLRELEVSMHLVSGPHIIESLISTPPHSSLLQTLNFGLRHPLAQYSPIFDYYHLLTNLTLDAPIMDATLWQMISHQDLPFLQHLHIIDSPGNVLSGSLTWLIGRWWSDLICFAHPVSHERLYCKPPTVDQIAALARACKKLRFLDLRGMNFQLLYLSGFLKELNHTHPGMRIWFNLHQYLGMDIFEILRRECPLLRLENVLLSEGKYGCVDWWR